MFQMHPIINSNLTVQAIETGYRIDGRHFFEYRPYTLKSAGINKPIIVSLGATSVMASSSTSLHLTEEEKAKKGFFRFKVDFSHQHLISQFLGTSEVINCTKIELSRIIEKNLLKSGAIDCESLKACNGKASWTITVTITIIKFDGNLIDISILSSVLCLLNTRLPQIIMLNNEIKILRDKPLKPISVHHLPLTMTFYFCTSKFQAICDPNELEESISEGKLTISMNVFKEICGISSSGNIKLSLNSIGKYITIVENNIEKMTKMLREMLSQLPDINITSLLNISNLKEGIPKATKIARTSHKNIERTKKHVHDFDDF